MTAVKATYYAMIFERLLKRQQFVSQLISNEIYKVLDALNNDILSNSTQPSTLLTQYYTELSQTSENILKPGELNEAYSEMLTILNRMIHLLEVKTTERDVLKTLKKFIENEALGGVIPSKNANESQTLHLNNRKLTKYQTRAAGLINSAIDAGENLILFCGATGSGRNTVIEHISQSRNQITIHCASPGHANATIGYVNGTLAKLADDLERARVDARLLVVTGAEVLFSPEIPMPSRIVIPDGVKTIFIFDTTNKYTPNVLADDMKFFGRKATIIELPPPTREHLLEVFGLPDHPEKSPSLIIDKMQSKSGMLNFSSFKRILDITAETSREDAVALVLGKTGELYKESNIEPTPSFVMNQIRSRVYSQPQALVPIEKILKRNYAGMKPDGRMAGAFLAAGPTGTGKTETALALAEGLKLPLLRIDLSEYAMPHTIQRLIGAPPSYIGYNDGAILIDFVKRHPAGVLLLDEAEKCSKEITQLFLGMMDSGTVKSQKGEIIDVSSYWIIFTTNAGMRNIATEAPKVGFLNDEATSFKDDALVASKQGVDFEFPPEFRNRLDALLYYNALTENIAVDIVRKFVMNLANQIKRRKDINLSVSDSVVEKIAKEGYSVKDGARSLRRMSESIVSDPVANLEPAAGDYISVDLIDGEVVASIAAKKTASTTPSATDSSTSAL